MDIKKSHELIQLEICEKRGINLDNEAARRRQNLRRGFEGEVAVYQAISTYGLKDVHLIFDYCFHHGKDLQVDILLVYQNKWLMVEVKNYYGHFEYRDNECYLNGNLMSENQIFQLTYRTQRLQHIARKLSPSIKVESVMVFVDEECQLDIQLPVDTTIIQMHQLKLYLKSLLKNYRGGDSTKTISQVKQHLDKYRCQSPFQPLLIEEDLVKKRARRGVHCKQCGSYDTYTTLKQVRCYKCNFRETKHLVIKRMAKELRYIFYYNPEKITNKAIHQLCNESFSREAIKLALRSDYQLINNGPKSYYHIPLEDL